MQMIVAVVKPNKAEAVKAAVVKLGVLGMTAVESKGFAKQMGHNERYRGPKMDVGWVPKVTLLAAVKEADKRRCGFGHRRGGTHRGCGRRQGVRVAAGRSAANSHR